MNLASFPGRSFEDRMLASAKVGPALTRSLQTQLVKSFICQN